jgi:cobalt/nickel transport system permease protein
VKHDFVDRYARLESPVHALDARAKIVALFALIVVCVTTPPKAWFAFCIYAALVLIIAVASEIPLTYLLTRALAVVPFVLAVAIFLPFMQKGGGTVDLGLFHVSKEGLLMLFNVTAKSLVSVACVILLSNTTGFSDLMHGFERLHMPKFFTMVMAFMYRYVFIIVDEAERMSRARDSRNYRGRWIWHAGVIGRIVASLFLRSQERAERVYQAMSARGFDGTFHRWTETHMGSADYIFVVLVAGTALAGRLAVLWT